MENLPKIALGAWAWGNDGTFGGDITGDEIIHHRCRSNGKRKAVCGNFVMLLMNIRGRGR